MSTITTHEAMVAKSRERFVRETAEHQMTVLKDDGLYRHLRFQKPGSSIYWFDIVTWPGRLVVCGDAGDWMFARIDDMFEFFGPSGARGGFEDARWGINPDYWSEKLQGPGNDTARRYSYDLYRAQVEAWVGEVSDGMGDLERFALRGAVDEQLLSDWSGARDSEHEAHRLLNEFEHAGHLIDAWELNLREYDWSFLWCCWAIVWGIGQYRAATPAGVAA